jgi:hypothetical protein
MGIRGGGADSKQDTRPSFSHLDSPSRKQIKVIKNNSLIT